jgi:hypothetical protein
MDAALSLPDKCANEEPCPTRPIPTDKATLAAALALSGLVITPFGWILFGTSGKLGVGEEPRATARRTVAPRRAFVPTLSAAPLRGGGVFGASFAF